MTEYVNVVLDELVPTFEDERGEWERVLHDARPGQERRLPSRLTRRRLVIIAAVASAIAIPLVALAATQSWWFFRFGDAPTPITAVMVVKTGSWDGRPWQLTAYRSATDGICFSIGPTATVHSTGYGAAMSCDQIEGVPRTPQSKPYTPHAITYFAGSSDDTFPAHIAGLVIDTADEVAIHLGDGTILRTPTFDAPEELGSAIRFYATRLPQLPRPPGEPPRVPLQKLVGIANDGRIVACLVVPIPEEGVPLSACR